MTSLNDEEFEFLKRDPRTWTGPEMAAAISMAIDLGVITIPEPGGPMVDSSEILAMIEGMSEDEQQKEVDVP